MAESLHWFSVVSVKFFLIALHGTKSLHTSQEYTGYLRHDLFNVNEIRHMYLGD